jgi:long-chain acyl-CoA synthetase
VVGIEQGLNIPSRSFIGIFGPPCEEWIISDYACLLRGYVCVPLATTFSKDQLKFIIQETKMSLVICSVQQIETFLEIQKELSCLQHIIYFHLEDNNFKDYKDSRIVHSFSDIEKEGNEIRKREKIQEVEPVKLKRDDIVTLAYTSGSTGTPKRSYFDRKTMAI